MKLIGIFSLALFLGTFSLGCNPEPEPLEEDSTQPAVESSGQSELVQPTKWWEVHPP